MRAPFYRGAGAAGEINKTFRYNLPELRFRGISLCCRPDRVQAAFYPIRLQGGRLSLYSRIHGIRKSSGTGITCSGIQ